jgi:hypothetical protein
MDTIHITNIEIIRLRTGPDRVILHTKLPVAFGDFDGLEVLSLTVSRGDGAPYCKMHFPNTPIVVSDYTDQQHVPKFSR